MHLYHTYALVHVVDKKTTPYTMYIYTLGAYITMHIEVACNIDVNDVDNGVVSIDKSIDASMLYNHITGSWVFEALMHILLCAL